MTEPGPHPAASLISGVRARLSSSRFSAIWIATGLLFLFSLVVTPESMSINGILSMLPFAAILAIAGIGQTLVVQQRGIDLSVASMISISAIIVTKVPDGDDAKLPLAFGLVALVAIGSGLVSGIAITRFRITPVVTTLGVGALLTGLALQITSGALTSLATPALDEFAFGKTFGLPNTVIVATILIAAIALVTRAAVVGRQFVAVGASPPAAFAAGLPVLRYQVGTYVVASLTYGVAAILLAGFVRAPQLNSGNNYLLATIAAVVLGGTSLAGGTGSVVATAVGAVFLIQLGQVVIAMGAPTSAQFVLQGMIIALGMGLRNVPWSRLRRHVSARANPDASGGAPMPSA